MRSVLISKMRVHVSIIVLLCLTIGQLFAVTITGKVTDAESGYAVSNATVRITCGSTIDSTKTNSSGEWEHKLSVNIRNTIALNKEQLVVSKAFPNPFYRTTKINFTLPHRDAVSIAVRNTQGETLETYRSVLPKGSHSFTWKGSKSAEVNFVTIQTPTYSITRKVVQLGSGSGVGQLSRGSGSEAPSGIAIKAGDAKIILSVSKSPYAVHTEEADVSGGEHFKTALQTIHAYSHCTDLHNDILCKMARNSNYFLADRHSTYHTDIPRLQEGQVDIQLFAIFVSPSSSNSYSSGMKQANIFLREMRNNPKTIIQCNTADQALDAIKNKKIAGVLAAEGAYIIENNIDKLKDFHKKGIKYLTITWNESLDWAICAKDPQSTTRGLSNFGRKVIRTLDTLGIIIDVAHTGIKTIEDILETTKNPIISSHTGCRKLRNHYRNLYDSQIKAIAKTGGLVAICFLPSFISSSGSCDIDDVIDHIDHVVKLVGVDHAAIGSDFDGISSTPRGLEDVSKFPALTTKLIRRGYSQPDIEKILGKNFLRVFKQVCGE